LLEFSYPAGFFSAQPLKQRQRKNRQPIPRLFWLLRQPLLYGGMRVCAIVVITNVNFPKNLN
jgi:hypothetical protein